MRSRGKKKKRQKKHQLCRASPHPRTSERRGDGERPPSGASGVPAVAQTGGGQLSPPARPPSLRGLRRKMATAAARLPSPRGSGAGGSRAARGAAAVSPWERGLSLLRGGCSPACPWRRLPRGEETGEGDRNMRGEGGGKPLGCNPPQPHTRSGQPAVPPGATGPAGGGGGVCPPGEGPGRGGGRAARRSHPHTYRAGEERRRPSLAEGYSPTYIVRRRRLTAPALLRAAPGRRHRPPPLVVAQFVQPPLGQPPPRHGR